MDLAAFGQNYPEEVEQTLDCEHHVVCCEFNRFGTILATGCNDGLILLWDFISKSVAQRLPGHVHPVSSLSWSRSGRQLLSGSSDYNVCIWDVLTGNCDQKFRFPGPIIKVQFHPYNPKLYLASPLYTVAVLVNADDKSKHKVVPYLPTDGENNIKAIFDRRGKHIYTANSKGRIIVVSMESWEIVASFKVRTNHHNPTAIKYLEFSRDTEELLLNCADRVIRTYSTNDILERGLDCEPEPLARYNDTINKTKWVKCVFSGDAQYICAGDASGHRLFIVDKVQECMVKILDTKGSDSITDLVWHPSRPIVITVCNGIITIWSQRIVENWSAYAPDFKELDENVIYEERESEFDITDEDRISSHDTFDKFYPDNEDTEVDVEYVESETNNSSDAEFGEDYIREEPLLFIPVTTPFEHSEDSGEDEENKGDCSQESQDDAKIFQISPRKKRKTVHVNLLKAPTHDIHQWRDTLTGSNRKSVKAKQHLDSSTCSDDNTISNISASDRSETGSESCTLSKPSTSAAASAIGRSKGRRGNNNKTEKSGRKKK